MAASRKKAKQAAADAVVHMVEDGMTVGLGTGSTASLAIEALGRRISRENLRVTGVPTSFASERLAREYGIRLGTLDTHGRIDLAFDGADECDPGLNLIKGRGAAHTREKIVAFSAARFIVLIDASKRVDLLGMHMPLPIEVVPMAVAPVMGCLRSLGARPELRMGMKKDGPVVTDQGLWVIDAQFDEGIPDPAVVDRTLLDTPGVLDHGLFLEMATDVLVGLESGDIEHLRRDAAVIRRAD
ncbi:MAG: ribose 5-phosphate isomerase A [Bacteroidetes bacterium CG12_big_fil_rev_8_21_14_0_65_60_17]|nr:MAG: ribose 5-phosphate isomerase A [Bacteroidetes bacterium CG12_big_fil_rev_8_21_14_0_65_60_17]